MRLAVSPEDKTIIVKIPFSTMDLEAWEKIAKCYGSDPVGVVKKFKFLIKQHRPDWSDLQLFLAALVETEKQLVLQVDESFAENVCKITQKKRRDLFLLQNPH